MFITLLLISFFGIVSGVKGSSLSLDVPLKLLYDYRRKEATMVC